MLRPNITRYCRHKQMDADNAHGQRLPHAFRHAFERTNAMSLDLSDLMSIRTRV